jgi:glyceraldehyde-3-phosphate dehydrogenase (NADP+)
LLSVFPDLNLPSDKQTHGQMDAALIIGRERLVTADRIEVRNAFDMELVGTLSVGSPERVDQAVEAALDALKSSFPTHARVTALYRAADLFESHADEIAYLLAREGSKTITEAQNEPRRAAEILRMSAEVARTLSGETLPFDARPGSEGKVGYYVRNPLGIIACILPFNDPVALVAHKVGPAIAAGNAVILKPDPSSSLAVVRACELLLQAGVPAGRVNVVTGDGPSVGQALVRHPQVRMISFTGGMKTGEIITQTAGIKKLSLELGSNSPVIVMADADLDAATRAVCDGAFAQAGQNCLGVQRVFVHSAVYEAFKEKVVRKAGSLRAGHSMDPGVDVCQMIRPAEADRVKSWIDESVEKGARVLVGGKQHGAVIEATVMEGVPNTARLSCNEVYGPVVSLFPIESLQEAVEKANAVDVGLHGAVFTESLRDAFYVAQHLEVGAVMVNETTDYRLDTMPFGGTKKSGIGREGVRFAAEEMTETRVVCFNL